MKSNRFQSQFPQVRARLQLTALSLTICAVLLMCASYVSAQATPHYGDCSVTTVGSPSYGPDPITGEYGGQLNGFLPFPSDFILNQNISSAAIDPNSTALINTLQTSSHNTLHILFGSSPADGDIPYYVTDSSVTPKVPVVVTGSPGESEVMLAPFPSNDAIPIEDDEPDCSVWPDTDTQDQHSLVLDRNGCWLYEIWVTSRCPGSDLQEHYEANSLTLFDATDYNARPWGFTSADAAGLSVYAETLKYDEAASGVINHAIRFTVSPSAGTNVFVVPATHGASTSSVANLLPEGAVLRLNPARTPSMSTLTAGATTEDATVIIPAIVTALQTYGMVMADNGTNMYLIGDNDPRWNDNDLGNLHAIAASDFDVIQMAPEYPGMNESQAWTTYYPDTAPTLAISSYTASVNGGPDQTGTVTVPAGSTVTFNFCVTGSNWNESYTAKTAQPYVYIDNIGPARLSGGCGSLTTKPTATQEYTLYAMNSQVNALNDGLPPLETINLVVTGAPATPAAVVFVPPPTWINGTNLGYTYASDSIKVTPITSTWAPLNTNDNVWNETNATYYYTTATGTSATLPVSQPAGTTPTTSSTKLGSSTTASITVTKAAPSAGQYGYETVCAIATVPAIGSSYGTANPSPSSCATYVFTGTSTSYADAPIILPPSGTYNTPQLISMATPTTVTTILYTTDGSTPSTAGMSGGAAYSNGNPPNLPTLIYDLGEDSGCYGSDTAFGATPSCTPSGLVYATNGSTIKAIAVSTKYVSAVTTATYAIVPTITFTQSPVTYGASPITLSATSSCPLGNPVTFTYVSGPGTLSGINNDTLTITGAGTVKVTANQASGTICGAATPTTANIVVNPAVLTVTANNQNKAVGAPNPTLTASYSGFQYSDDSGVLSGAPSLYTAATTSSPAGNYPITVTQGTLSAANYTFAFVNGTLSVVAAPTVVITTTATVTGSHSGGYSVAVKVTNSGTAAASNVTLTSATLGTTAGSPVPQSVATLGAGDSYTFTVTVPGSAGADGAGVAEKYTGTYTGGSFSASVRSVTLP